MMKIQGPEPQPIQDEIDVLKALLPFDGARVLELGCGAADKTRQIALQTQVKEIVAAEVDQIQHQKNLQRDDLSNVEFVLVPRTGQVIQYLLEHLYAIDIQSVIVEGGAALLGSFIESDLWDEARVFISRVEFGNGLNAPVIKQEPCRELSIPCGALKVYRKS